MTNGTFLSSLNLMTLIGVLAVAVIAFAFFMRKRSNRHPMDTPRGREIEAERRHEAETSGTMSDQPPER